MMTARTLGFSEATYAHLHRLTGAAIIRAMTLVAGRITADAARSAVHALRARHPMLDMRIVRHRGAYHFVRDGMATEDPVEIRDWTADVDPDSVLAESDDLRFGDLDLPYRLVLVLDPAGERNAIVGFFHHAMSDGSSAYALMKELVALIAAALTGELEPRGPDYVVGPPFEQQLVERAGVGRFFAYAVRALVGELSWKAPPHEDTASADSKPRTRMLVVGLTRKQSQSLKQRAARAQLGTTDLMAAALLLAEARFLRGDGVASGDLPLLLFTPFDYRHLLPPPFRRRRDVLSLAVFSNSGIHRVAGDGTLIETAQRLRTKVLDPGYRDPERCMFSWFSKTLLFSTLARRCLKVRRFCNGLSATHTGRQGGSDHPPLRLLATFGNICVRDGNLVTSLVSQLTDHRLSISFTYAEPFLSAASAERLVDHFLETLGIEGSVIRAEGFFELATRMRLLECPRAATGCERAKA